MRQRPARAAIEQRAGPCAGLHLVHPAVLVRIDTLRDTEDAELERRRIDLADLRVHGVRAGLEAREASRLERAGRANAERLVRVDADGVAVDVVLEHVLERDGGRV